MTSTEPQGGCSIHGRFEICGHTDADCPDSKHEMETLEKQTPELIELCDKANRVMDRVIGMMQEANKITSQMYSEIRDTALSGKAIATKDVKKLGKSIREYDKKIMAELSTAQKEEGIENNFLMNVLMRSLTHRTRLMPYGASAHSDGETYSDDIKKFSETNNPADLPPARGLNVADLHIKSEFVLPDLQNIVQEIKIAEFFTSTEFKKKELTITIDVGEEVLVNSYRSFNFEAFCEIMRNAASAMAKGGTLEVIGVKKDTNLILTFTDTGPGMPPETLAKVLAGGFTSKPNGTGQGLGLVRQYFEKILPGKFEIESSVEKGTMITITLPVAEAEEETD